MRHIRDRVAAMTPGQLAILAGLALSVLGALVLTGLFTSLIEFLVMLFIELALRISRLIFRW